MPIAVWNAWPARMARDSRSSASGNCSSNRLQPLRARGASGRAIGSAAPTRRRQRRGERLARRTWHVTRPTTRRRHELITTIGARRRAARPTARSAAPGREPLRRCRARSSIDDRQRPFDRLLDDRRCRRRRSDEPRDRHVAQPLARARAAASMPGRAVIGEVRRRRSAPTTNDEDDQWPAPITAPPSRLRTCRPAGGCPTPSAARSTSAGRRWRGTGR